MKRKIGAVLLTLALVGAGMLAERHVQAATWSGNWESSLGHWSGTVTYNFDDSGYKAWTDAEKKVLREAIQEWNDLLKGTGVSLKEGTPADLRLYWDENMEATTAGEMTGGDGTGAPTGVKFNPKPKAGIFVDPDPG